MSQKASSARVCGADGSLSRHVVMIPLVFLMVSSGL